MSERFTTEQMEVRANALLDTARASSTFNAEAVLTSAMLRQAAETERTVAVLAKQLGDAENERNHFMRQRDDAKQRAERAERVLTGLREWLDKFDDWPPVAVVRAELDRLEREP